MRLPNTIAGRKAAKMGEGKIEAILAAVIYAPRKCKALYKAF